jgi:hypothetical protein
MKADRHLVEAIFRERIERARRMPPDQKMWDGPRLFAEAAERMKDGLRYRYPEAGESEIFDRLRQQLARLDRLSQ